MSFLPLLNIGKAVLTPWGGGGTTSAADPQLRFFENFPGKNGGGFMNFSNRTMSIHAVNIPLSLSFNYPVVLVSRGANDASRSGSGSIRFGLYSMNGATLSLANSASALDLYGGLNTSTVWVSLITSATQNITPGAWYFGILHRHNVNGGADEFGYWGNSSINPGNAAPVLVMGRLTVSIDSVLPLSIATSELDITGSDATRQPYVIITA